MTHARRLVPVAGAPLAVGLMAVPPARASDTPSPEERARIEAKPHGVGFERWGAIERENDARLADGRELRRRPD